MSISSLLSSNSYSLFSDSITTNNIVTNTLTTNSIQVNKSFSESTIACSIYYESGGTYFPLAADYEIKVIKIFNNLVYVYLPPRNITIPSGLGTLYIAERNVANTLSTTWPFDHFTGDMTLPISFSIENAYSNNVTLNVETPDNSPLVLNSSVGFGTGALPSTIFGFSFCSEVSYI